MYCLTSFWVFWGYRDIERTLTQLVLLLGAPGLIYVFSSILVPANSADVESWRGYFFSVRSRLFAAGLVMILSIIFSNQALVGVSPMHSSQFLLYGMFAVFLIGGVTERPAVHNVLAVVPPLNVVVILLTLSQPEWNAP